MAIYKSMDYGTWVPFQSLLHAVPQDVQPAAPRAHHQTERAGGRAALTRTPTCAHSGGLIAFSTLDGRPRRTTSTTRRCCRTGLRPPTSAWLSAACTRSATRTRTTRSWRATRTSTPCPTPGGRPPQVQRPRGLLRATTADAIAWCATAGTTRPARSVTAASPSTTTGLGSATACEANECVGEGRHGDAGGTRTGAGTRAATWA